MRGLAPTLADLYAPIQDDLRAVQQIFDAELRSEFPYVNELCERVRSYRGKMLRPALLLLAARSIGPVNPVHRTLAAVVEMVHVATLVHDDVLDEAHTRRRRPTICHTEGNLAAVLLGDYLISHAYHLCSSLADQHAARRIGATTNRVCEGELLQNHHAGNDALTESEYLEIIGRKTGALTAVACELGVRYAGADEAAVEALAEFGLAAGIAFQIVDDVLDLVGDPDEVGKTLGLDLLRGKLTLPTIHCLGHAPAAVVSAIRSAVHACGPCDSGNDREPVPHGLLGEWLEETQSIPYALSVASEFVRCAVRQLDVLPPSDTRQALTALAEFITTREH